MAARRKILALTSIRSDYDLLSGLYRRLHEDPEVDLRLLVSGAHLEPELGLTVREIERDGFPLLARLATLPEDDDRTARARQAARLLEASIDPVASFAPDLVVYPGDREDTVVGGLLGAYLGIATVHLFGGDHLGNGHPDDLVRHAASKLSSFHLVSTEEHRRRLLALGEEDARIAVVGSVALDRIRGHAPLEPAALRARFGIERGFERFALLVFHPTDLENAPAVLAAIFDALEAEGVDAFVSRPNSDPGHRALARLIEERARPPRFLHYANLERELFLSVLKRAAFVIGNSSLGIVEASAVPVPAIDVGRRQAERRADPNVLRRAGERDVLRAAIRQALSPDFAKAVAKVTSSYGDGRSVARAAEILKSLPAGTLQRKCADPLCGGGVAPAVPSHRCGRR